MWIFIWGMCGLLGFIMLYFLLKYNIIYFNQITTNQTKQLNVLDLFLCMIYGIITLIYAGYIFLTKNRGTTNIIM